MEERKQNQERQKHINEIILKKQEELVAIKLAARLDPDNSPVDTRALQEELDMYLTERVDLARNLNEDLDYSRDIKALLKMPSSDSITAELEQALKDLDAPLYEVVNELNPSLDQKLKHYR